MTLNNNRDTAQPTNDLHKLFRCVVTLLTLVTAISNGGQSRSSVYRKPEALEENVQPRDRFLNALTTLLARNYEVIATAGNSSGKVLAFRLAAFEQDYCTALQFPAKALARVVAITNPQDDDDYSFGDNLCLLVEKGTSHIGERFGDWDQLLAIP